MNRDQACMVVKTSKPDKHAKTEPGVAAQAQAWVRHNALLLGRLDEAVGFEAKYLAATQDDFYGDIT